MASTVFVDGETLIEATWLNDVNAAVYTPGTQTAADIANVPAGNIAATDVQAAINELDTEKAPLGHVHAGTDITTGVVAIANGGTGQTTAALAFTALKQVATEKATGVVEIATQGEAEAGASDAVVMTALKTAQAIDARRFTSTEQVITSAETWTIAHGLGSEPELITVWLKCQVAEAGYSAGDKVLAMMDMNSRASSFVVDATNIIVRYSDAASVFALPNKTTGVLAALTNANWKIIVSVSF